MAKVVKVEQKPLTEAAPERRHGKERRLILRLLDYWRGITGAGTIPR